MRDQWHRSIVGGILVEACKALFYSGNKGLRTDLANALLAGLHLSSQMPVRVWVWIGVAMENQQ